MDEGTNGRTGEKGDVLAGEAGRACALGVADAGAPERDREESGQEEVGGKKEGYVYFIETEDGAYVKIGYTWPPGAQRGQPPHA